MSDGDANPWPDIPTRAILQRQLQAVRSLTNPILFPEIGEACFSPLGVACRKAISMSCRFLCPQERYRIGRDSEFLLLDRRQCLWPIASVLHFTYAHFGLVTVAEQTEIAGMRWNLNGDLAHFGRVHIKGECVADELQSNVIQSLAFHGALKFWVRIVSRRMTIHGPPIELA